MDEDEVVDVVVRAACRRALRGSGDQSQYARHGVEDSCFTTDFGSAESLPTKAPCLYSSPLTDSPNRILRRVEQYIEIRPPKLKSGAPQGLRVPSFAKADQSDLLAFSLTLEAPEATNISFTTIHTHHHPSSVLCTVLCFVALR